MSINLLASKAMLTGWSDLLPWNNLTNQQPFAFHTRIRVPGEPLASAGSYTGPDDPPQFTHATVVPECVHKHFSQLPKDERIGGANALILAGNYVYNAFARGGAFSASIIAWVLAPADGTLHVEVPVNTHYNPRPGGDGSPGAAVWRLSVDDHPGDWHTFQHGFSDRTWATDHHDMHVHAHTVTTIALQLESRSEAGIDFFTDLQAWHADFTPDAQAVAEAVDYVVVVHLLPQDATLDEKKLVLEQTHRWKRTVLQSANDAARLVAPGLPGSRVVVWDRHRWTDPIEPWLLDRGVTLVNHRALSTTPLPPKPEPTPAPGPEPPTYTLRSDWLIGLQSGFTRAQSFPYIQHSGTTVQKFFSAGDAYLAAKLAPGITSVWRRFVGNEQGRIYEKSTIRDSARWYLDLYTAEIETARSNMGLTLAQFLEPGLCIESLNETIPTYNAPMLEAAIEFDVNFCDLSHGRYGNAIHTVLACGAIGNPHESEVPQLLPAAKAAARWHDFLGYHCYWTDNKHDNDPSFLEQHWPYHAGRWMEWDKYFTSQGFYPRYVSGEIGTVYAHDGTSFNSGKGWKHCGSFERALIHIDAFNSKCLAWNALHGNRFAGGAWFGYGNWQWDNFELNDGDVVLLIHWANKTTPAYSRTLSTPQADLQAYITALEQYLAHPPTTLTTAYHTRLSKSLHEAKMIDL